MKKIIFEIKNFGFSLVEVTVALGLIGLASLAVMNLTDNVSIQTKRIETVLSLSEFSSTLSNYFNSHDGCKKLLNKNFTPGYQAFEFEKNFPGIDSEVEWLKLKSGRKFKNFNLKTLTAKMDCTNPDLEIVRINGVDHVKTLVDIKAEFVKTSRDAQNPSGGTVDKSISHVFSVPVLAKISNCKVFSCSKNRQNQEVCEALGKTWDSTSEECKPNQNDCLYKGSYVKRTYVTVPTTTTPQGCLDGSEVLQQCSLDSRNPFNYDYNCPNVTGYSVTKTLTEHTAWSHLGTCGQIGKKGGCDWYYTVNQTLEFYSCVACPNPP